MSTVLYLLAAPAMATVAAILLAIYAMHADKKPASADDSIPGSRPKDPDGRMRRWQSCTIPARSPRLAQRHARK